MMGESHCRELLYRAAATADLILIEGVMGLFDGDSSSADLAQALGVPVAAVIDAQGMAQTFAAVAHGLATYRPELAFAGVIANKVGSAGHAKLLQEPCRPTWRCWRRLPATKPSGCRRAIWVCCKPTKSATFPPAWPAPPSC